MELKGPRSGISWKSTPFSKNSSLEFLSSGKIVRVVVELSCFALDVGCLLAEQVLIHGFVDVMKAYSWFTDVMKAFRKYYQEQLERSFQIIVVVKDIISFDDGLCPSRVDGYGVRRVSIWVVG